MDKPYIHIIREKNKYLKSYNKIVKIECFINDKTAWVCLYNYSDIGKPYYFTFTKDGQLHISKIYTFGNPFSIQILVNKNKEFYVDTLYENKSISAIGFFIEHNIEGEYLSYV
jgi:hypothetical protein